MKKIKIIMTTMLVLTLMIGSMGLVEASSVSVDSTTGSGFTTLENPNPVAF